MITLQHLVDQCGAKHQSTFSSPCFIRRTKEEWLNSRLFKQQQLLHKAPLLIKYYSGVLVYKGAMLQLHPSHCVELHTVVRSFPGWRIHTYQANNMDFNGTWQVYAQENYEEFLKAMGKRCDEPTEPLLKPTRHDSVLKMQFSIIHRPPSRRDQDGKGHQAHHWDQAERKRLCHHLQDPREDCNQLLYNRQGGWNYHHGRQEAQGVSFNSAWAMWKLFKCSLLDAQSSKCQPQWDWNGHLWTSCNHFLMHDDDLLSFFLSS